MYLDKRPGTEEEIKIELHHYSAKLIEGVESTNSFNYENHEVKWLDIEEIEQGKHEVAPNINFLIDKEEIN